MTDDERALLTLIALGVACLLKQGDPENILAGAIDHLVVKVRAASAWEEVETKR